MAGLRKSAPKKIAPKKDVDLGTEDKTEEAQAEEVETAIEQEQEIKQVEEKKVEGVLKEQNKDITPQEDAKPKGEPMVKVKLKREIRTVIGSKFYTFRAGEIATVPRNVKDILMRAGYLEVI